MRVLPEEKGDALGRVREGRPEEGDGWVVRATPFHVPPIPVTGLLGALDSSDGTPVRHEGQVALKRPTARQLCLGVIYESVSDRMLWLYPQLSD